MADGDLYLSDSPNVDTGLVEQDGQLHRSVLTAIPEGTLQLSDSPNVSTGYVTDSDGKKHKVNLVAQVEGSLELSDNPSTDTGYVTDTDGKKHRVKLTAALHGGGSAPVIEELNVTPTTSAQTITAPEGTDGYNPVNVSAVTSSIDANIIAGNIKKDITILGVTGSYEGGAPAYYVENTNNNGTLDRTPNMISLTGITALGNYCLPSAYRNQSSVTLPNFENITSVGDYALNSTFRDTTTITGSLNLSSVTSVGASGLYNCFYGSGLSGNADLSSLVKLDKQYSAYCTFYKSSQLTSVDLSSLEEIKGNYTCQYMFSYTGLTSVSLSKLQHIWAYDADVPGSKDAASYMFANCAGLTSVDVSELVSIDYENSAYAMFQNCTGLTSMRFDSLRTIGVLTTDKKSAQYMFYGCTNLQHIYFPCLYKLIGNACRYFVNGVTGCTLHFPSNLSSDLSSYNFGGTNTTLLFDLDPVYYLNSYDNGYYRYPKGDTSTALAWKRGAIYINIDNNTYYTSGTTIPSVGDNIYTNPECTIVDIPVTSVN